MFRKKRSREAGWRVNSLQKRLEAHFSVLCFCFVQVSREVSVDTTLTTAQITTAKMGVYVWMVWTPITAAAHRNGQVRTMESFPIRAGHTLQEWHAGLLAFTQSRSGVVYSWIQPTSVTCSAIWGADVSGTLKRKLFSSKPPQWRAISHCTRHCYRLVCAWVWQTSTVNVELQCSATIRVALLLVWITL